MLTGAKNLLRFLKMNLKCNLLSAVEYKKSFIIQSLFMFINNFFFLIFWGIVFEVNGDKIEGITMNDILYLWSLPTVAFGMGYFFFGGVSHLGKYLIEGTLDTFLVQPKNVILNVATSGSDFSAFGDLMYGLVIGFIAVGADILKYLILILLASIAAIFYVCSETLVRLLTVWIGNTDNIQNVYIISMLITFSTYPEAIYGKFVKFLIYTVVPAAYIAFVPIRFLTTFNIKDLLILLTAAIIYIGITTFVCKKAFLKYESGNSMGLRG